MLIVLDGAQAALVVVAASDPAANGGSAPPLQGSMHEAPAAFGLLSGALPQPPLEIGGRLAAKHAGYFMT